VPDIVHYKEQCRFCGRPATKLCDYPVGEWVSPHMVKEYGKRMTCDAKMCDRCATNLGYEMDFCPKCMAKLKDKGAE